MEKDVKNINLACDLISENKFEEAKSILEEIIKENIIGRHVIKAKLNISIEHKIILLNTLFI